MMLSEVFYRMYGIPRPRLRSWIRGRLWRLEGAQFRSPTLRRIMKDYHGVTIGLYTHGSCFTPFACDPQTTIGRYCSIAEGVRIINHNHPMNFKSTHGFFFNPELGLTKTWLVDFKPKRIGNDVWIGTNAIIMPSVEEIGDGAVIAAGAVVNKNVPPYAVMVGNPARPVRYRFSPQTIQQLLASKWWEKSIEEISENPGEFLIPFETDTGVDPV